MIPKDLWLQDDFNIEQFFIDYDKELLALKAMVEEHIVSNDNYYEDIVAVAMLSRLTSYETKEEFTILLDEEQALNMVNNLITFITCENMVNKGLLRKEGNRYTLAERAPIE